MDEYIWAETFETDRRHAWKETELKHRSTSLLEPVRDDVRATCGARITPSIGTLALFVAHEWGDRPVCKRCTTLLREKVLKGHLDG